jgi:hypothetical protein
VLGVIGPVIAMMLIVVIIVVAVAIIRILISFAANRRKGGT